MGLEQQIKIQLAENGIRPSEKLGQHFLVDEEVMDRIGSMVVRGAHVVEVGAGTGHLTRKIAERASSVAAVEIDPRYGQILEEIQAENPQVTVHQGNILDIGVDRLLEPEAVNQIVANLPYHITEPFLHQLVGQPIDNAVLLVGDNTARELEQTPDSRSYGRMSLVAQTFFTTRTVGSVPRTSFFPPPRTDSNLIEMRPKDPGEISADRITSVLARLVTTAPKHGLVVNELKSALVESSQTAARGTLGKRESSQRNRAASRRQAREWVAEYNSSGELREGEEVSPGRLPITQQQALGVIEQMRIDPNILRKPFSRLDNQDLRELVTKLQAKLG